MQRIIVQEIKQFYERAVQDSVPDCCQVKQESSSQSAGHSIDNGELASGLVLYALNRFIVTLYVYEHQDTITSPPRLRRGRQLSIIITVPGYIEAVNNHVSAMT